MDINDPVYNNTPKPYREGEAETFRAHLTLPMSYTQQLHLYSLKYLYSHPFFLI